MRGGVVRAYLGAVVFLLARDLVRDLGMSLDLAGDPGLTLGLHCFDPLR